MIEKKLQRGFTLAELLVVMAALGIVSIAMVGAYLMQAKLTSSEIKLNDAQIRVGDVLADLARTAGQADEILSTSDIGGGTYLSGPISVFLSLPAVTASGNILSNAYDLIVFFRDDSNNLQKTVAAASGSKRPSGTKTVFKNAATFVLNYEDDPSPNLSDWFTAEVSTDVVTNAGSQNVSAKMRITLENK